MSGEREEQRLFGLMAVAEQQQAAVQAALEGLATERAALQRERRALAAEVAGLGRGAQAAVRAAVADSLAGVAPTLAAKAEAATQPLLGRLSGVVETATQAQAALRRVVLWASWRLLGWGVAVVASLGLLWWLASGAVLWWDAGAIGAAQLRKAQLEAEVAELQASADAWKQAGMLDRVERCGPRARPCVRVDEGAGAFQSNGHADYRIIQGY